MSRPALDVSELPEYAFGNRDPMFWGLTGMLAIESTMIALLVGGYFYLRGKFDLWPPSPVGVTAGALGAVELALLLASCLPTLWLTRAAQQLDLRRARRFLWILTLLGAVVVALRVFEFRALGFRWDSNAYGSMVWAMLGIHALHVGVGVGENAVFLALMLRGPIEKKFMVDVYVNGLYWYFVVAGWVILYATVYLEPVLGS
jgi:heme/copper-type cytochrome/quinol oxidase subunit 3